MSTLAAVWIALVMQTPPAVEAQVAGRGTISVSVSDRDGFPLQGVQVLVSGEGGDGVTREITTASSGVANFYYLEAGSYRIEVERLGYVPVRVRGVIVATGERERLMIELRESPPPVTETDEFTFAEVGTQRIVPGYRILGGGIDRVPVAPLDLQHLYRASSATAEISSFLPLRYVRSEVEGVPAGRAHGPNRGPGADTFDAFAIPFLRVAAFRRSTSVEGGPEGPGSVLEIQNRTGGSQAGGSVALGAAWTAEGPDGLAGADAATTPWVSGTFFGPLQGDTVRFSGGFSFERSARAAPTLLGPESSAPGVLSAVGGDWNGQAIPAGPGQTRERDALSGYSRLDWALGDFSSLVIQAQGAMLPEIDPVVQPPLPEGTAVARSGSDLFTSSRLLLASEDGSAMELNLGFGRSSRVTGMGLDAGTLSGFAVAEEGMYFGAFRGDSGEFSLSTLSLSPVATLLGDRYRFRAGGVGSVRRWSDDRVNRLEENVLFSDAARVVSQPAGAMTQAISYPNRAISLNQSNVGFFAEARWWAVPSVRLTTEIRVDRELLPRDDIRNNPEWEAATGIARGDAGRDLTRWSPSVEVRWEPPTMPGWSATVRGEVQPGQTDPSLMGIVMDEWGRSRGIRSLGASSFEGTRLYLLGPNFEPPRGELLTLRLEGAPTETLRIGLDLFRHQSELLPRRRDLNLARGTGVRDQFGRTHRGAVVQRNDMIAIEPGSDRRIPEFAEVWALESDGWSRTTGATVSATVETGLILVDANYTRSETLDNAPFGLSGFSNPTAGFLGDDLREAPWVEGRSDNDRPNRMSVIGTVELPIGRGSMLSAGYQMMSGRPFTVGVRDALGSEWEEGWARLQPIALPGEASLPTSGDGWSCDRSIGSDGRLERNACRGDALHTVDLRVDLGLPETIGPHLVLRIDALNLLDQRETLRDGALYVVDGAGSLSFSAQGTQVALPVVQNPTFGEPIARLPGGRSVRFGLEYRF